MTQDTGKKNRTRKTLITRETLLDRLTDPLDAQSWEEFIGIYWPLIFQYARSRGCSPQMAADVFQETMINLVRGLPKFEYDRRKGRFRSFLLKIVDNRIVDIFRKESKFVHISSGADGSSNWIETIPDEAGQDWGKLWDRQFDKNILRRALMAVRHKVQPATYKSFRMNVLDGISIREVCETLVLDRNTVYQHKSRVIEMLKIECDRIKALLGE